MPYAWQNEGKNMKIRKIYPVFLILAVLCFIGCQKNPEKEHENKSIQTEETQVKTEELEENKETKKKEENDEIEKQNNKTEEKQENSNSTKEKVSKKITEDGIIQEQQTNPITLKDGKAWGELPVVGEEDAVYCNLQENIKETENLLLFCPEPLYGMTYYVNHGNDYFIYVLKEDGKAELVVEIPAKRLFFRDGKLYFMVESYDKYIFDGLSNGDILSYNPIDGKVSVVIADIGTSMVLEEKSVTRNGTTIALPDEIAVTRTSMTVYQDGIYYIQEGEQIPINSSSSLWTEYRYYYSFESQTAERMKSDSSELDLTFVRWGEYLAAWEIEEGEWIGRQLLNQQMQKERSLGFMAKPYFYLIGDKVYSISKVIQEKVGISVKERSEIIVNDMVTGEEQHYLMGKTEDRYFSSHFLFKDTMYFRDLYSYSFTKEEGYRGYCNLKGPNHIDFLIVAEYYTDRKELYALCELDGKIYRVEEYEEFYELPYVGTIYDRRFEFLPIGE